MRYFNRQYKSSDVVSNTVDLEYSEHVSLCKLDIEFGKMTNGKTDLFIRRWEASIIPKLKAVAAMERGDVASLTEGMEDQTDGMRVYLFFFSLHRHISACN